MDFFYLFLAFFFLFLEIFLFLFLTSSYPGGGIFLYIVLKQLNVIPNAKAAANNNIGSFFIKEDSAQDQGNSQYDGYHQGDVHSQRAFFLIDKQGNCHKTSSFCKIII